MFITVHQGGTLHIMEDFDAGAVVIALSDDAITATTLVPAMIQACPVLVPDVGERRFDTLRFIVYGASPGARLLAVRHSYNVGYPLTSVLSLQLMRRVHFCARNADDPGTSTPPLRSRENRRCEQLHRLSESQSVGYIFAEKTGTYLLKNSKHDGKSYPLLRIRSLCHNFRLFMVAGVVGV